MNRRIKVIIAAIILCITVTCVIINTKASEIKGVLEYFWGDTDENISYLVKEYNQTVVIDDYIITLDSAAFDDKTGTIYSKFIVSKNNAKVEAYIYLNDHMTNTFGEDNRFSLLVNADIGGQGTFYGKYVGNDLIIYCKYQYLCEDIEDTKSIYLADGKTGKITYENSAAKFFLESTSNAIEIKDGNTKVIYVSPMALKISSVCELSPNTIEICYKNGATKEIYNVKEKMFTGNEGLSCASKRYTKVIGMPYLIDVEQVECIIYNGEMYRK